MGYYALMVIPYFVIFIVPLIMMVRVVVHGLTLPAGLRRGRATVCGRCSHEASPVTDTSPLPRRCPECGTPYATGGLLTLGLAKRTRPGMAWVIVSWTILMVIGASVVSAIIGSVSAYSANYTMNMGFSQTIAAVRTDGGSPTNAPGYDIRYDGTVEYQYGSPATSGSLSLSIRPDNQAAMRVGIDLADLSWSVPSAGLVGASFDDSAALSVLAAAGIDTSPAYVVTEAGQLAQSVALIRQDPDTGCYSVLNTYSRNTGQSSANVNMTTGTWYPMHLNAFDESGDSTAGLSFRFAADGLEDDYSMGTGTGQSGGAGAETFDGQVRFSFTPDAGGGPPAIDTVTVTIRGAEGWPATMTYSPSGGGVSINHGEAGTEATERTVTSHTDALRELGLAAGLPARADIDPGLVDIADLIDELEHNPTSYDPGSTSSYNSSYGAQPPIGVLANAGGDGVPDGGLEEMHVANQNYQGNFGGPDFPVSVIISLGVAFVLWVAGIVGIVYQRSRIYPPALVGSQGPPDPSAAGPSYSRV